MTGWARGWTVGVVQFVKSGKWKMGERKLADHLGIEWQTLGDGFTWESTDLDETAAKGRHAWDVHEGQAGHRRLRPAHPRRDHLRHEIRLGAGRGRRRRPARSGPQTNVVLTGRDAPAEIIEIADTVTEMRKVKHAYDRGITGRKGIEY